MRQFSGSRRWWYVVLVLALLLSVVAVACQGPAGKTGPAGPAGQAGPAGPPGKAGEAAVKTAATVVVTPGSVVSGRWVTSIAGSGFKPEEAVLIVLEKAVKGEDFVFAGDTANKQGAFSITGTKNRGVAVAAIPKGAYTLKAIGTAGSIATTPLQIVAAPKPTVMVPAAQLWVEPRSVESGRWVSSMSGTGFKANETVLIVLVKAVKGEDFIFAGAVADKEGAFYLTGTKNRGVAVEAIKSGTYVVKATGTAGTVAVSPLNIRPKPTPTPKPKAKT